MGGVDILVFVVLGAIVIGVGLYAARGEKTHGDTGAQDYFLAGRGLTWWLIGFSLIAANISTEQFVGMSGDAANWLGMAIASYEWMAAVTLVLVAFLFLPKFLKCGIYTIPEFLEYRYNTLARTVMALVTLVILVGVPTASVIFSGAKVITGNFQGTTLGPLDFGDITLGCWILGIVSAAYVFTGGLKACAWTDLLWGSGLILGGVVLAYYAAQAFGTADPETLITTAANSNVTVEDLRGGGAWSRFWDLNGGALPEGKLHMVRPKDDSKLPWTALVLGLWIPNIFYWGLNQYITQRTLASKSLREGQKGIMFAAFLKLIIPFIVVIPGILAFNLFNTDLKEDAVNRNARIISQYSPELYGTLSEGMKPKDEPRNTQVLAEVKANLDKGGVGALPLYKFNAAFAKLHPTDVPVLFAYNASQAGMALAAPADASAEALATLNIELLEKPETKLKHAEELTVHDYDNAFPTLVRKLLPIGTGVKGFVLIAIFGAVVSSLASMLNSASTIATMDIYAKLRKNASQYELVSAGRVFLVLFVLIAMIIAPSLGHPKFGGIFTFIQEFQGFISPGILAIFLFGVLVHRAPRYVGTVGLVLNPMLYGFFKFGKDIFGDSAPRILNWAFGLAFLDRMGLCFGIVLAVLGVLTLISPLKTPVVLPVNPQMDVTPSRGAFFAGILVCIITVALYIVFW